MSSAENCKKRTINSFFAASPSSKRPRISSPETVSSHAAAGSLNKASEDDPYQPPSKHSSYPHPISSLPSKLYLTLNFAPEGDGRIINNKPDLDLLYYTPYIPSQIQHRLFTFLRAELPFYRVKYTIKRGSVETLINTPRYTTVFGVDETSYFSTDNTSAANQQSHPRILVDSATDKPVPSNVYKCRPRPIPSCLDALRLSTEAVTGERFNFCLVNYYASGADSISYHSDDERFLGDLPCIASFSLGARRDFLMRHKEKDKYPDPKDRDLKLDLASGDMVLMRGKTQSMWLHSIPKRKGGESDKGRINITFRKALVKGGTENYYRYNVGDGEVYRWDDTKKQMVLYRDNIGPS